MLGYEKRAHLSHFGVIVSNLSVAMILIACFSLFSTVMGVLLLMCVIVLWLLSIVFSLGLILLSDGFRSIPKKITGAIDALNPILSVMMNAVPYLLGGGLALAALSIVFLAFEPSTKKHGGRIAVSVCFLLLAVAVLVGIVLGGR